MPRRNNAPPPLQSDVYDDMTELEPSPIAESPTDSFPTAAFSSSDISRSHTFGHGGLSKSYTFSSSSGGLSLWLARSQRYSSYAFTSFLGLHLTATSLVPLITKSLHSSDNALLLTRTAYQSTPLLESILIPGSLSIHVLSGVGLRLRRYFLAKERYGKAPSLWDKREWSATSIAGWLLLPPLIAHGIVLRIVPLYLDGGSGDVGLQYVSHGFWFHGKIGWWVNAFYYVGFVGVASWHVVNGFAKYFRIRNRKRINLAAGTLTLTWLSGLFGIITPAASATGYLGRKYDEFYGFVFGGLSSALTVIPQRLSIS